MTYQKVEQEIAGRKLVLETGKWAKQASGSVLATYGGTTVLVAAQNAKAREGLGFFPLTVDYREKTYAAGKFPGGFFKREARPTTKEVLTCRLIDRSIRPLFPDGYLQEVQVMATVLVYDQEVDPDVVAMIGAFAALSVSEIPFMTHLGACRLGYLNDEIVVNPGTSDLEQSRLNLTMAATKDTVAMVEAGANEVGESVILDALEAGQKACGQICKMIEQLAKKTGKKKVDFEPPEVRSDVDKELSKKFMAKVKTAINKKGDKADRSNAYQEVSDEVAEHFTATFTKKKLDADEIESGLAYVKKKLSEIKDACQREGILAGKRVDGRGPEDIREITVETGILPRVHGSAVFSRGETQALVVTTLGTVDDEQIIDGLEDEYRKKFLLHYNFPPYSVGECRMIRGVGRREIGHGALAERSVMPVLPPPEEFPYTIRVVSEILESNGSSSMASVCGCCSALMDAGVPIRQPVAGIAMGLVKEGRSTAILSDILGSEDHCGDMDFKVAGTQFGITALQMDIKCSGLTRAIMERALEQAKKGRIHILKEMLATLKRPRKNLSAYAPRLSRIHVNPEKIGIIIGPGGKNIRALQEETRTKINVDDDGTVIVSGLDADKVDIAVDRIQGMTAEVEIGQTYKGRVVAIKEFGAFVEVLPGQEGLLHVSEITDSFVRSVTDVLDIGDEIEVRVVHVDDFGKIKLSRKILLDGEEDREELVGAGAERDSRDSRGSRPERSGGRRETGRRAPRRSPAGGSGRRPAPRNSGSRPRRRNGD